MWCISEKIRCSRRLSVRRVVCCAVLCCSPLVAWLLLVPPSYGLCFCCRLCLCCSGDDGCDVLPSPLPPSAAGLANSPEDHALPAGAGGGGRRAIRHGALAADAHGRAGDGRGHVTVRQGEDGRVDPYRQVLCCRNHDFFGDVWVEARASDYVRKRADKRWTHGGRAWCWFCGCLFSWEIFFSGVLFFGGGVVVAVVF